MIAAAAGGLPQGSTLAVVTPSRSMEDEAEARRRLPAGAHLHMGSETWFGYGIGQAGTALLVRTASHDPPPWQGPPFNGTVLGQALLSSNERRDNDVDQIQRLVTSWLDAAG